MLELEENRSEAPAVRNLLDRHREGEIEIAISNATASENQKDGTTAEHMSVFESRLRGLGLHDLPRLVPLGIWGFGYWGAFKWADDASVLKRVELILFGDGKAGYDEDQRRWRNQTADVLTLVSHIEAKREMFVTLDRGFHRESIRPALEELGAGTIATPAQAVRLLHDGPKR